MQLHALRVIDGENLHAAIEAYVKKHQIKAGFIVSGVAGLKQLNIRLAGTPDHLPTLQKEGQFEVVSIDGTVSVAALHIHIAASDGTGNVVGGHLLRDGNIVRFTAEIGIVESDGLSFGAEMDTNTGFRELVVSKHD